MAAAFYLVGVVAGLAASYFGYCAYSMHGAILSAVMGGNSVALFQLLNIQDMNVSVAIGLAIISALLIGVGAIIEALRSPRP